MHIPQDATHRVTGHDPARGAILPKGSVNVINRRLCLWIQDATFLEKQLEWIPFCRDSREYILLWPGSVGTFDDNGTLPDGSRCILIMRRIVRAENEFWPPPIVRLLIPANTTHLGARVG